MTIKQTITGGFYIENEKGEILFVGSERECKNYIKNPIKPEIINQITTNPK